MSNRSKMGIFTTILSVSLMLLLLAGSIDISSFDASALTGKGVPTRTYGSSSDVCGDRLCSEVSTEMKSITSESMKNTPAVKDTPVMTETIHNDIFIKTEKQTSEGVGLEFSVPEIIHAKSLVPINARVFDSTQDANLSHTDWAYAITDSQGNIIHKSTTLHGHFGIMNFKDYFPESGTYTIIYTTLSSGPFMLGSAVPELGQTRSVVTGDLLRFEEDPKTNFGSRTFEFTVDVLEPEQSIVLQGSESNGEAYFVKFTTIPTKVVVGEPVTIILDVNDYNTGKDATHVDGLISIIPQHYYQSDSGDQPEAPISIPLHGAYHGHIGSLSVTQVFEKSGTVLVDVSLSSIPYSVPLFGQASTEFIIQVFDSPDSSVTSIDGMDNSKGNVIDIVGLASPFYVPNTIHVSTGDLIMFDNVDANPHTVTSVKSGTTDPNGEFDSGLLNIGESYELTINDSGTYDYFCALHTGMIGTIIVE